MSTFQDYKTELRNPTRQQVYKIEWMDKEENVLYEVVDDMIEGSISIQLQNGMRRSCNLTFKNDDGLYTPSSTGLVYLDKKIKIYSGLVIDGENYFPTESIQGVFNMGNPIVRSSSSSSTVSIEGYDNFSLLDGTLAGEIYSTVYQVSLGTAINDAVEAILSDASIIKSPYMYTNSEVLYYTLIKEAGNTYADALLELANMMSYEIYFNVNGRPIFDPPVDEINEGHVWEFLDTEVSYLGSEHNYNYADVRNHVIVYGENINGDLISAEAEDQNVASPTNTAKIGKRTKTIRDTLILDAALAQDRADYELKKAIQSYEYSNIKTYNVDFLKEGDIVLIYDSNGGYNADRYIIKQINRSLSFNGEMSIQAWKVRDIT